MDRAPGSTEPADSSHDFSVAWSSVSGVTAPESPAIAFPSVLQPAVSGFRGQHPEWLVRALGLTVAGLALLSLITTFLEPMPRSHYYLVPLALVPVVLGWTIELSGIRRNAFALIALVGIPNLALSAIGHVGANFLFLLLLVAWLTYSGTRTESIVALSVSMLAVATLAISQLIVETIALTLWSVWAVGLVTVWVAARLILAQQQLLMQLNEAHKTLEHKARESEALFRADEQLYRSLDLQSVLQAVVDTVTGSLGADKCALMVWDDTAGKLMVAATSGFREETIARMQYAPGEGIAGIVFQTGSPVSVEDTRNDHRVFRPVGDPEGIRSVLSLPLFVGGEVFGVFGVNYCEPRVFTPDDIRLFQSLAQRAEVAISNARIHDQARRVATLEERQRLARDLHDSATQSMYSARMYAEAAARLLQREQVETALEYVREIQRAAGDALAEMRLLIHELRPPILERDGLVAALRQRLAAVEERAGIQVDFAVETIGDGRTAQAVEQHLYGIAREALNNALKHGRPGRIELQLIQTKSHIRLEIFDDGIGFDPDVVATSGGNGLDNIRERAASIDATLRIESSAGHGTRVSVEVEP